MSIPKRRLFAPSWDSPPLDSSPGHINPKTIWDNSILTPLRPFPVILTCNVRMKNAIPRRFCSGRITSGNSQPAIQAPLWHFPVFRTCNVGMKIGLPRRFCSGRVTSGNSQPAIQPLLDIEYPMVHNSSEFPQTDCGFSGNIRNDNANSTKFI